MHIFFFSLKSSLLHLLDTDAGSGRTTPSPNPIYASPPSSRFPRDYITTIYIATTAIIVKNLLFITLVIPSCYEVQDAAEKAHKIQGSIIFVCAFYPSQNLGNRPLNLF